jgi:hypothetical protein
MGRAQSYLSQDKARMGAFGEVLQVIADQVCLDVYNKIMMFPNYLQVKECNNYVESV